MDAPSTAPHSCKEMESVCYPVWEHLVRDLFTVWLTVFPFCRGPHYMSAAKSDFRIVPCFSYNLLFSQHVPTIWAHACANVRLKFTEMKSQLK